MAAVAPEPVSAATLPSNCVPVGTVVSCTFGYNGTNGSDGAPQPFTVPAGVSSLTVDAWAAQGGSLVPPPPPFLGIGDLAGGLGGHVRATFAVAAGEQLSVRVGGQPRGGSAGFNGGGSGAPGGGGASDVRVGGDDFVDRVLVAGGGGGSGEVVDVRAGVVLALPGGAGGGVRGGDGTCAFGTVSFGALCGGGGSSLSGGSGGQTFVCSSIHGSSGSSGGPGTLGQGGGGGTSNCTIGSGVFVDATGSGGGGGFFGGGGGGAAVAAPFASIAGGPGGGGSGRVGPAATDVVDEPGARAGNGLVVLSYPATPPDKDACKHGGWRNVVDGAGRSFGNQGQCVDWAVHHLR